jgi:Na+/H+ antiporter NhaA
MHLKKRKTSIGPLLNISTSNTNSKLITTISLPLCFGKPLHVKLCAIYAIKVMQVG